MVPATQLLDEPDLLVRKGEILDGEIFAHVDRARRASEWKHADLPREPKRDLCRRAPQARRELPKCATAQLALVGREQRKSLIDDAATPAKVAHAGIPPQAREAAVLH